nr:translation initiation factor IF-2-like [Manis javanica]
MQREGVTASAPPPGPDWPASCGAGGRSRGEGGGAEQGADCLPSTPSRRPLGIRENPEKKGSAGSPRGPPGRGACWRSWAFGLLGAARGSERGSPGGRTSRGGAGGQPGVRAQSRGAVGRGGTPEGLIAGHTFCTLLNGGVKMPRQERANPVPRDSRRWVTPRSHKQIVKFSERSTEPRRNLLAVWNGINLL